MQPHRPIDCRHLREKRPTLGSGIMPMGYYEDDTCELRFHKGYEDEGIDSEYEDEEESDEYEDGERSDEEYRDEGHTDGDYTDKE